MMTSFLSRSFRRTLHTQQEGKIVKNISAGQNLEVGPGLGRAIFRTFDDFTFNLLSFSFSQVKDQTWDILQEEGAIIEEAADDDIETDDEGGPQSFDEKVLGERVAMHVAAHSALAHSIMLDGGTDTRLGPASTDSDVEISK